MTEEYESSLEEAIEILNSNINELQQKLNKINIELVKLKVNIFSDCPKMDTAELESVDTKTLNARQSSNNKRKKEV